MNEAERSHRKAWNRRSEQKRAFRAIDTRRLGLRVRLAQGTHLLGLGTTGSQVVHSTISMLQRELGQIRLPRSVNYLMIDAAAPRPGMDTYRFHQLAVRDGQGVNGSGTDPRVGFSLFHEPRTYRTLHGILTSDLVGMAQPDPQLPWLTHPREAVDFWVVAGPGGTSGGALHPAIGLLHDVAQARAIQQPRVHVVLLGAEMPLRDPTRQVLPEQEQVVRATAAGNLTRILDHMASKGTLRERRPDGSTFPIEASRRVWSLTLADQSNGGCEHPSTASLIRMLARALLVRLFTQVGIDLGDRLCDADQLGATGRRLFHLRLQESS